MMTVPLEMMEGFSGISCPAAFVGKVASATVYAVMGVSMADRQSVASDAVAI